MAKKRDEKLVNKALFNLRKAALDGQNIMPTKYRGGQSRGYHR